jgi:hypothetical protein
MRDAAIVRATLRELGPLLLGTLAVGLLVALSSLKDVREMSDSPNTWPLCVLPVAALFGGLAVGGGTKTNLVHLLSRPVSRLRVLAWRWGLLLVGLAILAIPLWSIGLNQFARGPGLWSIAIATVLASAFGAQGATVSDREANALAGALMLGGALVLPMQLSLQAEQITWTRLNDTMGWLWLVPLSLALVVLAAPVAWSWSRELPVRGVQSGARTVLASLVGSLVLVTAVLSPMTSWVAAPERGQLLAVVAMSSDGLVVATGTRGEDGERDVVDGLVVIDANEERRTIWDRSIEAPDTTVWFIAVPEITIASPFDDTIHIAVVDGPEPSAEHPLRDIPLAIEIVGERPNPAALDAAHREFRQTWDAAYGSEEAPLVVVQGHSLSIVDLTAAVPRIRQLPAIRATEITFDRRAGFAIADGRIWAVLYNGSLWSAPVPWEAQR